MKLLFCISLCLLSFQAKTQDHVGNGGDAIICEGRTMVKDYWEYSQMMNNLVLDLGEGGYLDKVRFVLNRLKKVDEYRATLLLERLENKNLYSLVDRGTIPNVNDSNSLLKPRTELGCVEVQVAFQILTPKMYQSKILIDKKIFNAMDEAHKAGLILHELLYEHDIKFSKAKDSDKIRWFNYLISSNFLKLFDDLKNGYSEKYATVLIENKLDYFGYSRSTNGDGESYSNRRKGFDERLLQSSSLLPKVFSILNSELVDDGKNPIKGNLRIESFDYRIMVNGHALLGKGSQEYRYEFDSKQEVLTGELSLKTDGFALTAGSISTSDGLTFHLSHILGSVTLNSNVLTDVSGFKINGPDDFIFENVKNIDTPLEKFICPAGCTVKFQGGVLVEILGQMKSELSFTVLSLTGGVLNQVLLAQAKSVSVTSKKLSSTSYLQKLEYRRGAFVGRISVPKTVGPLTIADQHQSLQLSECKQDRCVVDLVYDKGKLVSATY